MSGSRGGGCPPAAAAVALWLRRREPPPLPVAWARYSNPATRIDDGAEGVPRDGLRGWDETLVSVSV